MKKLARALALAVCAASLGGCSLFGGLTQSVGSLLSLAISLAVVAAPFALSYWLYTRDR